MMGYCVVLCYGFDPFFRLTYVIAYARDHCIDVTRRYTNNIDKLERNKVSAS